MTRQEIKERYEGVQDYMGGIKDGGCLFLSLCTIIEEVTMKPADIAGIVRLSVNNGWIKLDYTVNNSIAILNHFTSKEWKRIEVSKLPTEIKDNEFTIEKWYNKSTGYNHFRRRFVDTLLNSQTVKKGKLEGYYIYSYTV